MDILPATITSHGLGTTLTYSNSFALCTQLQSAVASGDSELLQDLLGRVTAVGKTLLESSDSLASTYSFVSQCFSSICDSTSDEESFLDKLSKVTGISSATNGGAKGSKRDLDTRVADRLRETYCQAQSLIRQVEKALENGGKLEYQSGWGGVYRVLDAKGNIIAAFKPDDERNWGPNNRDPEHRRAELTDEDIYFRQVTSFEQGKVAQKQFLANLLEDDSTARAPRGAIIELESDQFFNPTEGDDPPKAQRKVGFLQEWIPNAKPLSTLHPAAEGHSTPPETAFVFRNHPVLAKVPLDEFQKVGILDILLFNEDRHAGNVLVTRDAKGNPHLVPIDHDAILPVQPKVMRGLLTNKRAKEPFSKKSLAFLKQLDPEYVAALAEKLKLPKSAIVNTQALALVLKKFAAAGLTLADISAFITLSTRQQSKDSSQPTAFWKLMVRAKEVALEKLPKKDIERYRHKEHLRYLLWDKQPLPKKGGKEWLESYKREHAERIDKAIQQAFWKKLSTSLDEEIKKIRDIKSGKRPLPDRYITIGTTYVPSDPQRSSACAVANANHQEYAERWEMRHSLVAENLLKKACTVDGKPKDCSPYWNKIALLRNWLRDTSSKRGKEEWRAVIDDDMIITNMQIDPYKAIDQLRGGKDTSIIVTEDVIPYTGNSLTSVNTGALFVRKDDTSRKIIEQIWEKRNERVANAPSYCPTLGVCQKQHTLHEQQALSDIVRTQRGIVGRDITIVPPRDTSSPTRGHIALNTFERSGEFIRDMSGWTSDCFSYGGDPEEGKFRKGDWMAQAAGVPIWGWYCDDKRQGKPPGPMRRDKLLHMVEHTVR